MPRDARLVRRNLLVLPGAILAFHGLAVLVYVLALRSSDTLCNDATRFLIGGKCYSALTPGFLFLLVGAILMLVGGLIYRARPDGPEQALRAGTPTHAIIAVLSSIVVSTLILAGCIAYQQASNDALFVSTVGGYDVRTTFLLQIAASAAAMVLATMLLTLLGALLRRRCAEHMAGEQQAPPRFPGEPEDTPLPPPRAEPAQRPPPVRVAPAAVPAPVPAAAAAPAKPLSWQSDEGVDTPAEKR